MSSSEPWVLLSVQPAKNFVCAPRRSRAVCASVGRQLNRRHGKSDLGPSTTVGARRTARLLRDHLGLPGDHNDM